MYKKKLIGLFVLLFSGLIFSAAMMTGYSFSRPGGDIELGAKRPPVELNADATAFSQAFIEVAERVTPSIVQITVVAEAENDPHQEFFFPFKDFQVPKEQMGSGSGIIVTEDGYILTNNHVVENAKSVSVLLSDKRKFDAKVIGRDKLTDLAVVKISASNLPLAYLGNSEKLKVGQWVMAIGNPLALSSTVTAGIVSALNRGQLNLIQDSYGVENFIQTDAAINPGNSGGALVDLSGAVIGINTAIASRWGSYVGYGFAIPINLAKSVAKDLINNGKVSRGYIGVQIREVDGALAKSIGLDKPKGVIVEKIVEGGAAASADIKRGDVILKVDNIEVSQPNQLQSYVASKSAGSVVTLQIFRDGSQIESKVTLKPRDETSASLAEKSDSDNTDADDSKTSASFEKLGMTVKTITDKERERLSLPEGLLISKITAYGKAQLAGLSEGIVITKADKKKIESVSQLEKIINSKKGNAVLLEVTDSKGNSRFVGIEIPE